MLADFGHYVLIAATVLSFYSIVAAAIGARSRRADFVESSERAMIAVVFLVFVASGVLLHALLTRNFHFEYAAHYTSTTLPLAYCVTAFWGGQSGSMLFWLLVLSVYTLVVLMHNQNRNRQIIPYVNIVMMSTSLFFLLVLDFVASPFVKLPQAPIEGQGLNPLLQNYWMATHPPALYIGYVGQVVPFAFAMGALLSNRLDIAWIKTIRRWSLFSWLFLTLGILQGAYWAYIELGWGGYWAWDPVENASLMPWLASTAFLHSVMIQEKKGMLKVWNMVLVITAFGLSIFGTFLTRSGVVSSVHAFAQSSIGTYFLVFLAVSLSFAVFMVWYRRKELRPEAKLESFISRESSFLFNNIFFLVICVAVLLGTTFPIISEAVTGSKVTVSAPFFNKVVGPFAIGLLLLTGICPLIAWRKAGVKNLERNFLMPAILGLVGCAVLVVLGIHKWVALLYFFSAIFVLATVYFEFSRGTQARTAMVRESIPVAFWRLIDRNRRRYGGFIIHAGMAVVFVGIAASSYYSHEQDVTIPMNGSAHVRNYVLSFKNMTFNDDPNKQVVRAIVDVKRDGKLLEVLTPERHFYKNSEQPTTEVAIRSSWREDLYMVLLGWGERGTDATFKVYINPLIGLIWRGGVLMALGGLLVLLPPFHRRPAVVPARESTAEETA